MNFSPELLKQLLNTFQTELEEGSTVLINGLVDLEQQANDPEIRKESIENIFRTAHNLKGAARGLGITSVSDIAHTIETAFSSLKESDQPIPKATIDACLEAVDKMAIAMQAYIDKTEPDLNLQELKERITASSTLDSPAITQAKPKPVPKPNIRETTLSDTIHVPLKIIDKLSELSEEVQSNKIELDEHSHSIKTLARMIRDFNKNWKMLYEEINNLAKNDESQRIQKNALRLNDDLLPIMSKLNRISIDMNSQANDYSRLSQSIHEEIVQLRLVPTNNLLALLPRYVRELAHQLNKKVELNIQGEEVYIDKYVLEGLKDPIIHLLRNAIDHGIESPSDRISKSKNELGKISINVKDSGNKVYFEISDDGAGLNYDAIKHKIKSITNMTDQELALLTTDQVYQYIFESGFSTKNVVSDISGRGVGLDVVYKNIQALKGTISIQTNAERGTTFTICVPLSISSERGLIIRCSDQVYVLPTSSVQRVLDLHKNDIVALEGGHAILINNHPVIIQSLASILGLPASKTKNEKIIAVVLKTTTHTMALSVDQILGEREIVIKPIQDPLSNIPCVSGATLLDRNKIAIILDSENIMNLAHRTENHYLVSEENDTQNEPENLRILIVDDSITTRTMEKNILESKNYHVTVASNGQEAWDMLQNQTFALIITDVNMPIMNGFELTEKIKSHDRLSNIPVIIVTSLGSDAEKSRGMEVGANAYIVKNEFESGALLQMINQLI